MKIGPRATASVDLGAIRRNVAAIRELVGPRVQVMAVVKADAYGHGARQVAREALRAGAAWLGVATVDEGVAMRDAHEAPGICVFAPFAPSEAEAAVRCRLTPLVCTLASARDLSRVAVRCGAEVDLHLEVDTGMGRSGVQPAAVRDLALAIAALPGVRLAGLATHFPSAEDDPEFTCRQIVMLDQTRSDLAAAGLALDHVHCANSAGIVRFPAAWGTMVRPGLLLYGIRPGVPPGTEMPAVEPAMRVAAPIVQIRDLPAGHTLSYARTCTLRRPSRIAVLPIGYGDGYPRALSNRWHVLIGGQRAPIVGRVCMDVMLADVTNVPQAVEGSEAVLIGQQGEETITAAETALAAGTTEHDVTTRLLPRVPRLYTDGTD